MICKWTKGGKGLFSTTATAHDGEQYHLMVERAPGQSKGRAWDWATWSRSWEPASARHGYAASAKAGMAAAESAATKELIVRAHAVNAPLPTVGDRSGRIAVSASRWRFCDSRQV
jgi:hypothetical protein